MLEPADDLRDWEEEGEIWNFRIPLCECGGLGIKDEKGWYCATCKKKLTSDANKQKE